MSEGGMSLCLPMVASSAGHLGRRHDHLLFSFHGLPERHMRKADPTGKHCMQSANCCEVESPAHATCYRAQCFKTVRAFVSKAGLAEGSYSVSFQSRLGREPWLKPYTDEVIKGMPARGIRKLLVMCPAFVCDCLETIEEIGMRAKEDFLEAGGEELVLVPCLNEHPLWVEALHGVGGEAGPSSALTTWSDPWLESDSDKETALPPGRAFQTPDASFISRSFPRRRKFGRPGCSGPARCRC